MKYVIEQLSILSGLEISVPLNYLTIIYMVDIKQQI